MTLGKPHLLLLLLLGASALCLEGEDSTEEIADDDLDGYVADAELANHTVEVVPGLMGESQWLLLDNHWLLVTSGQGKTVDGMTRYWECRFRREKITRCPYKMLTGQIYDESRSEITRMMDIN